MKKQLKGILALTGVLAVLGGGFAALKLTEPKDEADDSSDASVQETTEAEGAGIILVNDTEDITIEGVVKSAVVTNATDELHIKMLTEKTEDSAATYTLEGYEDVPVNTSIVGTLVNNGNGIVSQALIESGCEDLAKFGLEEPAAEVEFTYESGNVRRFFVGDKAPSGSYNYFMVDDGQNNVYTVNTSTVANYSKTLNDFIRTTVLESPEDDAYPIVETLKIERGDLDYDILIKYDEASESSYSGGTSATHVMVEPTDAYLTVEKSSDITNGMFGLSAKSIYALHCKESDIAEAGLNDPFCKVTMSCDDGSEYVLLLSELFTDDGGERCCYGMLEGGNVIYTIAEDNAKWISVMPVDIASRIMIAAYVWNVTELSAESGGEKVEFEIEQIDKSKDISEVKTEDFKVKKNGEDFDTERYRLFYSFLVSTNAEEFALGEEIPDSEPMAKLEYTDSFSGKTTTIEFYDYSVMKSLIVVDGKSKFFCTKSYVSTLEENIRRIGTGEDYVTSW